MVGRVITCVLILLALIVPLFDMGGENRKGK